ncbi:sensor histidine kinase [Thiorhodovibrio frisius]|uniref:histidine kinase n=1 Tax=Thiorhodovibrio frisius TaxID=631362 RepID=H8YZY5_9GAMM|nr:ATP-binding protein [Thiorhodovibrio frisius]EIC22262.1 histidine kinase [Thiorhodovibrio frisius]WPL24557.1 Sensor protein ZraS [Thiorhodovibrio frisius]
MQESTDSAPPSKAQPLHSPQALGWLLFYRLSLALALIVIFFYPQTPTWLSAHGDLSMARLLLKLQTLSVLIGGAMMLLGRPKPARQIELAIFLDLVFYTLLMHVSGGISTGLGLILAIVVAAGATTLEGRLSLLFAALATLAVIFQQFYAELYASAPTGNYTQAGLLGVTYFAVALLAHVLSRRLHETEHLAARRQVDLADLSKLNEFIIQSMSTGVLAVTGDRSLLVLNNAAKRLLGVGETRDKEQLERLSPALNRWVGQALASAGPNDEVLSLGEYEVRPRLQRLDDFRAGGALIFLDDNRQLMREAQEIKLASLGRLTASIAHNIRNPLSSITHAGQLLTEAQNNGPEEQHLLNIVRRNALRIDETVTSILELSRRDQPQPQRLDLGAWLREFRDEYTAGNRIDPDALRLHLPEEPISVSLDPRHFGQVLRNLCENAFLHGHAESEPTRVDIRLTRVPDSNTLHLAVVDNGPGVLIQHVSHLFDPFFTTASTGTGLGLYTARELCEANGLRLEYSDQPPPGAHFRVILPI